MQVPIRDLDVTYLAQTGAGDYTQVNEPAPLNPGRVAEGGSFAFSRRRKEKAKAIKDETFEDKEARLTQKKFNNALKEVSGNVSKNHGGPATQFIRKVRGEGGPNYPILHSYVTKTRRYMEPKELESQPKVIREYEKNVMREAWAFDEWKRRLYDKVEKGELPRSVEAQMETYNILDMFDDMKAHALRKATASKSGEFAEEFSSVPPASRKGVLMWSNRLALQHGEATYNDLDEILFEISTRAEPRDLFLLGASSRVRDYCDETYERLVGKANGHAFRDKTIRPWHVKKDQETPDAELQERIPINKYYG